MSACAHLPSHRADASPRVLVVEDVVLVRLLVADTLRGRGFAVVEAATGEEAIRVLESDGEVQAVLSDIYMPGAEVDGIGLAQWVHRHRPEVKVLLGSGVTASAELPDLAGEAGRVLRKPYDFDEVERRLRAALA
jgi:CheY-like chemotaxis protein